MTPALAIHALRADYGGAPVLDGIDLTIARGEAHCLLGPNGAGKTTLIRAILGRVRPRSGRIALAAGGIGLVPQDIALFSRLTVAENLAVFARIAGVSRGDISARVAEVTARTGLAPRASEQVAALSGGWRRRANLASAILHRPALLLLDEPIAGIDVDARQGLHELLRDLAESGMALLMTTHDLEEATAVCDHVAMLAQGRISLAGRVETILADRYGTRAALSLTLDAPVAPQAARVLDEFGFVDTGDGPVRLVDDEDEAMRLVARLRAAGAELRRIALERPGLDWLHREAQRAGAPA